MEKRHYARYIYEPTMTAISVEESTVKLLLNASGVVLLHREPLQPPRQQQQEHRRMYRRENLISSRSR